MRIKCWGSRGSLSVCGPEYQKYGGDTTCLEIRSQQDDVIIVDAGTGIRRLGNALMREGKKQVHFLFTHAHWDHLIGFPFFKPLYHESSEIFMHRCPFGNNFVETMLSKVMAPPYFPIRYNDIKAKIHYDDACPLEFTVGPVAISPIPLSHPNRGSGYRFMENGRSMVFLTDNELGHRHEGGMAFDDYVQFCRNTDLLIHDAEYTPDDYVQTLGWGHSCYTDVVDLAIKANVRQLGLFHVNQDRSDPDMDAIVDQCRQILKAKNCNIDCFGVESNREFHL
ncbi:MAG: MBL fold metallo-hydrolase [Desulfatirhabdiaceae bacterium]